jgi:hypothetical protein
MEAVNTQTHALSHTETKSLEPKTKTLTSEVTSNLISTIFKTKTWIISIPITQCLWTWWWVKVKISSWADFQWIWILVYFVITKIFLISTGLAGWTCTCKTQITFKESNRSNQPVASTLIILTSTLTWTWITWVFITETQTPVWLRINLNLRVRINLVNKNT